MIKVEYSPSIALDSFNPKNRDEGLSGFIRARNEGEYIYQVIESWIDLLDELVIVYNNCTDNTESEIERAIKVFGSKIKAFHYLPKVYPQGSDQHIALSPKSINSLVFYYNFALSKTTKKYAVKIDGDIIFDSSMKTIIKEYLNRSDASKSYLKLHGVNLIDEMGELFVPHNNLFCGLSSDLCIFPVSKRNTFIWQPQYEKLCLKGLKCAGGFFAYYHMKYVKSDLGMSNYLLKENPSSKYSYICKRFIIDLRFLSIAEVLKSYDISLKLPHELNIQPARLRSFKQAYIQALEKENIKISDEDWKAKTQKTIKRRSAYVKLREKVRSAFQKSNVNLKNTINTDYPPPSFLEEVEK